VPSDQPALGDQFGVGLGDGVAGQPEVGRLARTAQGAGRCPLGRRDDPWTAHFEKNELGQLLGQVFTINTWNLIALTTARVPGTDERAPQR
jgi:hypothetical protein